METCFSCGGEIHLHIEPTIEVPWGKYTEWGELLLTIYDVEAYYCSECDDGFYTADQSIEFGRKVDEALLKEHGISRERKRSRRKAK